MTTLLLATALSITSPTSVVPNAQPNIVREVQYLGADHVLTADLRQLTGISSGERMAPQRNELGRQAILRRYHDDGRLFASVELVEGNSPCDTRVVYQVVEGPMVKVAEVQFRGNKKADAAKLLAAKKGSGATVGAKFRPSATDEDVLTLGLYYRSLGQDGTTVVPEVVRTAGMNRVIIVYHIVESQK